jgi:hypothetical protein
MDIDDDGIKSKSEGVFFENEEIDSNNRENLNQIKQKQYAGASRYNTTQISKEDNLSYTNIFISEEIGEGEGIMWRKDVNLKGLSVVRCWEGALGFRIPVDFVPASFGHNRHMNNVRDKLVEVISSKRSKLGLKNDELIYLDRDELILAGLYEV